MSNLLLGVNIDHIATLRNARGKEWPDPIQAAFIAEQSGADSITVHLREDRRHITDRDIYILRKTIQTRMNLEISVTDEMIAIACKIKPNYCCLVPEHRKEITTEGGLNVYLHQKKILQAVSKLTQSGIQVSLFIDADENQISAAAETGVKCIEIHTGAYADATNETIRSSELIRINKNIKYASTCNLKVNAGHGLNYHNVKSIAMLSLIQELNIGHSIISRSVICGLSNAVKDMKCLINEVRR